MENREHLYYHMPFYMTYPMQNLYLMEMEYEKDMERMKELYPKDVQHLQKMVEYRCDEMEYEGSRMYDENPDRRMLEEEVRRILEKFLRENPQYDDNNWLQGLIVCYFMMRCIVEDADIADVIVGGKNCSIR